MNVQIPYWEKDDRQKGALVKILWYNLEAKNKDEQVRIATRFATALTTFPDGGDRLKKIIDFVIDQETAKGNLIKEKRTDYEWAPEKPGQLWPKDEIQPPIPPDPQKK